MQIMTAAAITIKYKIDFLSNPLPFTKDEGSNFFIVILEWATFHVAS